MNQKLGNTPVPLSRQLAERFAPPIIVRGTPRFQGFEVEDSRRIPSQLRGRVIDWLRISRANGGPMMVHDEEGRPELIGWRRIMLHCMKGHGLVLSNRFRERAIRNSIHDGSLLITAKTIESRFLRLLDLFFVEVFLGGAATFMLAMILLLIYRRSVFGPGALPLVLVTAMALSVIAVVPYVIFHFLVVRRRPFATTKVKLTSDGVQGECINGHEFDWKWDEVVTVRTTPTGANLYRDCGDRVRIPRSLICQRDVQLICRVVTNAAKDPADLDQCGSPRAWAIVLAVAAIIGAASILWGGQLQLIPNSTFGALAFFALCVAAWTAVVCEGHPAIKRVARRASRHRVARRNARAR